jgi:hypothetical protein
MFSPFSSLAYEKFYRRLCYGTFNVGIESRIPAAPIAKAVIANIGAMQAACMAHRFESLRTVLLAALLCAWPVG